MNAGTYTIGGEDVPLGMECALPYLDYPARSPRADRIARTNATLYLVKRDRHAAALETPDPVRS